MLNQHSGGLAHRSEEYSPLSPRELQVLSLLCEGHATKTIAFHLGISFKTAACYRMRLMEKAGVHNSISLFRWALARGLVSADLPVKPTGNGGPVIPFPGPCTVVERKPPGTEKQTVLVVDDDRALRQFVAAVLEQEGYETLQAQDGSEAIQVAERNRIDLLLTDFEMPGISGLELIRKMHQQGLVGPALIVTGHGESVRASHHALEHPVPLLSKPFTCRDLLVNVRSALGA